MYSLQQYWHNASLYRVAASGKMEPVPIPVAGDYAFFPSAAKLAHRLVFARYVQDSDMYVVETGNEPKPFMALTMPDYSPQFSPDGKRIVFVSSRSGGSPEVFTANADGSDPLQLTKGGNAGAASWSPDGRWICSTRTAKRIGIST